MKKSGGGALGDACVDILFHRMVSLMGEMVDRDGQKCGWN